MGFLKLLFILLILSIPFGVITRISFAPNAYVYLHDIFVLLIFIVFLYKVILKKAKVNFFLLKPFLIFVCFALTSLLFVYQTLTPITFLISLSYLIRYILYFSLIFSLSLFNKDTFNALKETMVISGLIFIFFGFIQYFFYPNLRNLYYLGWDEHLARFFSTFLDPNYAGAFLVLYLLFVLQIIVEKVKPFQKSMVYYMALAFITLTSIFFTYSRSAFLMLLVGVFLFLFFQTKPKIILLSLGILVLLFLAFANPQVEEFNPLRVASSKARVTVLKDTLMVIQKNPIFGVGFNAYRYAQVRYGLRTDSGSSKSNADAGTDNSFFFVLATTGIVGFLIYLYIWKDILGKSLSLIRKKEKIGVLVFSSIIALFADSLFVNSLFYPLIIIWVFILIGFMGYRKQ